MWAFETTAVGLGKSFNKAETPYFLFQFLAKGSHFHSSPFPLPQLVVN